MDDDALALAAEIDGLRFSDWYEGARISRSTAFELLKVFNLTLEQRPVPDSRRPVLFVDGNQRQLLDAVAQRLGAGETTLAELKRQQTAISLRQPSGTVLDDPAPSDDDAPLTLLDRLQAVALALETGAPLTTAEVRQLLGVWPGSAEVHRGRIVARRHGRNAWTLDGPG
jgi:hypothetical protein